MTADEILAELQSKGVTLLVDGGLLKCRGKQSALTPELLGVLREHKEEILSLLTGTCACSQPIGPAECGPAHTPCAVCGYTWRCPTCGGCRQCVAPGRKVRQPDDEDLPFPIGYGGLDAGEVERAEYHNTRLGVVDPVARRLNVLFWLMQHYQDAGDTALAGELKAAYCQLRDSDPELTRLVKIGETDQDTMLKRLRNGQRWLSEEHGKWLADDPKAAADHDFQKALDGWVALEVQLRERHGYQGCIFGPDRRCPEDAPVTCDACVQARSNGAAI